MKINIIVKVDVPEGATHYLGVITKSPIWVKRIVIDGVVRWWTYQMDCKSWFLLHRKATSPIPREIITVNRK